MKAFFIRCKRRCKLAAQGRDSPAMRDLPTPIPGTRRLDRFGLQAGKTHLSDGNMSCDRSSAADETAASWINGAKSGAKAGDDCSGLLPRVGSAASYCCWRLAEPDGPHVGGGKYTRWLGGSTPTLCASGSAVALRQPCGRNRHPRRRRQAGRSRPPPRKSDGWGTLPAIAVLAAT